MVSNVHGGDGKTKVFLDTGVSKVLLYGYENLGGREGGGVGREGGGVGTEGGREGGRRDRRMEAGSDEGTRERIQ